MKITRTQLRKLIREAASIEADREVNYQVAKGDSWWKITAKNSPGRTPEENAALNNMSIDDVLQPCQVIKIWSVAEYEGGAINPNCGLNESEYSDKGQEKFKDRKATGFSPEDMHSHYAEIEDEIWSSNPIKQELPEDEDPEEIARKKMKDAALKRAQSRFSRVMGNPYFDDY